MFDSCSHPRRACLGCPAPEAPQTLEELTEFTAVELLSADLESLAMVGTYLESALVTTRSPGAMILGQGGYGPFQTAASPWRLCPSRITLRVAVSAPAVLARSEMRPDMRLPGSIVVLDGEGAIWHRVQVVSDHDLRVAASLEAGAPAPDCGREAPDPMPEGVVPLTAIRTARRVWDSADTGEHLNDLLADGGKTRRRCLPHIGTGKAWRCDESVLPSFLEYLCERSIPLMRSVPGHGLLQAQSGALEDVARAGSLLMAACPNGVLTLDMARIDTAWVVVAGRDWQIELYDGAGQALAVLGADPWTDRRHWQSLLASLPPARQQAPAPPSKG
ncbi:MAG: hypothetical protein AAGG09_13975 [Pseudomonadota bacterium]